MGVSNYGLDVERDCGGFLRQKEQIRSSHLVWLKIIDIVEIHRSVAPKADLLFVNPDCPIIDDGGIVVEHG